MPICQHATTTALTVRQSRVWSKGNTSAWCDLAMPAIITHLPYTNLMLHCTPKRTVPGHDKAHYDMLRHLSCDSLNALLWLFNKLWDDAIFPHSWENAHVITLLKPGKDPSLTSTYRPISVTSNICKTF